MSIVRTSEAIKKLAAQGQYGQARTPRNFYMGADFCSFYWGHPATGTTFEQWKHMAAVSDRYHRLVNFATEELPGWTETSKSSYADNSVESNQVCKCGQHTRRVMVTAPNGDRCF